MNSKECVAIILTGGRGRRLGSLTRYYSKPAIHFGGNYRIIDFTLSNCNHSRIDTVGIISRHFTADLQAYISEAYEPMPEHSDFYMLSPQNNNDPYKGTADAVYKNIEFIERFEPENVLVLSADHIYNMDYNEMLAFHIEAGADVTVASTPAPVNEAFGFGIIDAGKDGRVRGFEQEPLRSNICPASMGIYVFRWSVLKRYLMADSVSILTRHDFGKDILPKMLHTGESVYTYRFDGYWREVGTVGSLWKANMELLNDPSLYRLRDYKWDVQGSYINDTPNFISREAVVSQSIIAGGCSVSGKVEHSVLSDSITVGQNAEIVDSVVMPGVYIGSNAKIHNAVIGTGAIIMNNTVIGADDGADLFIDREICSKGVSLISPWVCIAEGMRLKGGSHIYCELLEKTAPYIDMGIEPGRLQSRDGSVAYHVKRESVYHQSAV